MLTNKKLLLGLSALFLIVAVTVFGTIAYFSKSFTSSNNVVTAATFNVDVVNADGQTIKDGEFHLDGNLFPGMEPLEAYTFHINKNETNVPVEYSVSLTPTGELLVNDESPLNLTLQRLMNDEWVTVDYAATFRPERDVEKYRVMVDWPHGNNDIAFQGKSGNVKIEVVATQVDPEEEPTEPEGPPYYTGEVKFKATHNGSTRTTTNKEVVFYTNDNGMRVVEILMGDGNGDFETRVGKVTVTEELHNGIMYFRVVTENEYYASPTQAWRSRVDRLDLSVEGVVNFPATLSPYLSIESEALYNWFQN
ncbi:hypothetical protein [Sutcliffiella sp. NC1]|uniref:hypothetical protein n=1 Tax=Sutcliffiella sp. NC1 TaxID=3004096 RepID=UPI0022DE6956|nr:hypothetical protein [Sutcliffiella sp. NC1]WBL14707.1 hypothetical protein O1A01_22990 [Sutcliffiella sp. NC1]